MTTNRFSEEKCRQFAAASDPHQWLLVADNLHSQALALQLRQGQNLITLRGREHPETTWDEADRATFLLAAFALENAIKAFLVYEFPEWIENGQLSRKICPHRLVELAELSSLIPYRIRDSWVLAAFESGNESWMRYPCGRNADDLEPQGHMTARLWSAYRRVARGYGRKLKRLLAGGWKGPHGTGGYWTTTFEWLA